MTRSEKLNKVELNGNMLRSLFAATLAFVLATINVNSLTAQNNAIICKGDKYFDQNMFDLAKKYYADDCKSDNKKIAEHAMLRLADCYRITGEFEAAETAYKKLLKKKKANPEYNLNYGLSLKNSAKFEEAKQQFAEYIKMNPADSMGRVYLRSCDSAQTWLDMSMGKEVKNLEKINTSESEFSPVIVNNKLYFSSSRPGSKEALISLDGGNEMKRMDIYSIGIENLSSKTNNKKDVANCKELNTSMHEGNICFSKDGNEVFFTRTVKGKRDKAANGITNLLQIFYSKKDSTGHWTKPVNNFAFNSQSYSTGHPALSENGKTLFYMSDKPGGFGKTDIYFSRKKDDGTWTEPINAGNGINTFGYELFPAVYNDSTLYFSSNAHIGMGQLDIFKSVLVNGKWSNVQNLYPPINSIGNDFGITFDGSDKRSLFSSDRFNGKGSEDIYAFSEETPLKLTFRNDTLEFADKLIFDDIKYKLLKDTGKTETELISQNGVYRVKLENKSNYVLAAKKNGFPVNKVYITFTNDTIASSVQLKFKASLKQISVDGYFSPSFFKPSLKGGNFSLEFSAPESKGDPLNFKAEQNGHYKYDGLLMPNAEYSIHSQLSNP